MTINRLFIFLLLLIVSTSVHAQRFNKKSIHDDLRHGQSEEYLLVPGSGGHNLSVENGCALDVEDTLGWGFTIGGSLNDSWKVS